MSKEQLSPEAAAIVKEMFAEQAGRYMRRIAELEAKLEKVRAIAAATMQPDTALRRFLDGKEQP